MPINLHRLAQEAARRREEQLVTLVAAYAATACPFPVTVYVEESAADPYGALVVRAAGVRLATRSQRDHYLDDDHPGAQAARLGLEAAAGYAALEPLPHDHHLGQD